MAQDGVDLSYGQVETLVRGMLEVADNHASKLTNRFKELRRAGFPHANAGSGPFRYDFDAALKALLAFQVMRGYVPAVHTVALLRTDWPLIARTARAPLRRFLAKTTDAIPDDGTASPGELIVFEVDALIGWKAAVSRCATAAEASPVLRVHGVTDGEGDQLFRRKTGASAPSGCRIVLDLGWMVDWLARALLDTGWASVSELQAELGRPH